MLSISLYYVSLRTVICPWNKQGNSCLWMIYDFMQVVWVGINDDWKDFRKVISLQAMKSF
jgi:hypothetical protein